MSQVIDGQPDAIALGEFADWIRETDPHAEYHLELAAEAERVLRGEGEVSREHREELADKLERWRYQLLNHFSGQLAPTDWDLADTLDLASNALADRPARPPRLTRVAVGAGGGRVVPELDSLTDGLDELEAYLQPEADVNELIERARGLTIENFSRPADKGTRTRVMKLYAPLYLSNYCINHCLYCGFRYPHKLERMHLDEPEAFEQAEILWDRGFRHVLLVAGDFPQLTSVEYFEGIVRKLRRRGFRVAIEIAPQSTRGYARLAQAGVTGLTLYQETYDEERYRHYHPRGSKASYDWRLEGHERAAEAGIGRLGLGILLGLRDPVRDLMAMIRHGRYLRARFPKARLAFSLPRIHEAPDDFEPPCPVDDELFVRLYCVLRLAFPDADLVLSTREPVGLRNRLAKICITQMSAGSRTAPGGYEDASVDQANRQQFPVADHRSPAEVARWLREHGFALQWEF
ncbi:MAG: radical SAM protein [Planctomycetes bacterium]|nr:radical SAM protein [Planctomycetota bacterium]